jgi:hypothetical protein
MVNVLPTEMSLSASSGLSRPSRSTTRSA